MPLGERLVDQPRNDEREKPDNGRDRVEGQRLLPARISAARGARPVASRRVARGSWRRHHWPGPVHDLIERYDLGLRNREDVRALLKRTATRESLAADLPRFLRPGGNVLGGFIRHVRRSCVSRSPRLHACDSNRTGPANLVQPPLHGQVSTSSQLILLPRAAA